MSLHVGFVVRQIRREKGLTQIQLSEIAGIHQPNLSRIESGNVRRPQLLTLASLAKALGVEIMEFSRPERIEKAMLEVCPTCGRHGP